VRFEPGRSNIDRKCRPHEPFVLYAEGMLIRLLIIIITAVLYSAPKVVYSGALPAQPRSNNVVLRPERNRGN